VLVFCIVGVMASSILEVFQYCYHGGVCSRAYLGQIVPLHAVPFQILRCLSDSMDPRWHNNTQEMATEIVYIHIL